MKSSGKAFEQDIKASVPADIFYYRFRDGTARWGKQEETRFQAQNISDCMLYNGNRLYLLELKSHKGSSLPFTAIRKNQLTELSKASTYKNITAGFIINFAEKERTFFCKVDDVLYFMEHEERKSVPLTWCEKWGREIKSRKLKVNYRYDLERWLSNAD
jgi:recombination protein U